MTQKEKSRPSVASTQDGRRNKSTCLILRQSGYPVNGIFSCGFVCQVFVLLSEPISVEEIAAATGSTIDRVRLALHDLMASGVKIIRLSGGVC